MDHCTGIQNLSDADINTILSRAQKYADTINAGQAIEPTLSGKIVMNLFFENSTRTRTSFETAALRLGANVINWDIESSSLKKNESFSDTIQTLAEYEPDAIVIRHSEYGAPDYVANLVQCPVINAGDSWREHPTQALLDALTIRQAKGTVSGLTIAICGDVGHSRVASSNIALLSRLGATVRVIAPDFLMPETPLPSGVEKFTRSEDGLPGCDIVMMLRNQKERMDPSRIPSDIAFFNQYGLTAERFALAKPDACVMHPGPMNRGVEIADDVADDPTRSLILKQVRNGVPVRMAILDLLINR